MTPESDRHSERVCGSGSGPDGQAPEGMKYGGWAQLMPVTLPHALISAPNALTALTALLLTGTALTLKRRSLQPTTQPTLEPTTQPTLEPEWFSHDSPSPCPGTDPGSKWPEASTSNGAPCSGHRTGQDRNGDVS
jgi:hypothetical protein